jgi:hypothetical protein
MTCGITNDFSSSLHQDVPAYHDRFRMHQHSENLLYTQYVEQILYMSSAIQMVRKVFFLEYHNHLR